MKIYNPDGTVLKDILITKDAEHVEELMKSDYVRLSWADAERYVIPAGAFIEPYPDIKTATGRNIRYVVYEDYVPEETSSGYTYKPEFLHQKMYISYVPFVYETQDSTGKLLNKTEYTYVGRFDTILKYIVDRINDAYGFTEEDKFTYENIVYTPNTFDAQQTVNVQFSNNDRLSALSAVCEAAKCNNNQAEYFIDWINKRIYIGAIVMGSDLSVKVGENANEPSIQRSNKKLYNRYIIQGSTRNMNRRTENGNIATNVRLTLDDNYPDSIIDLRKYPPYSKNEEKRPEMQGVPATTGIMQFDDVYPHLDLYIYDLHERRKYVQDEKGNNTKNEWSIWYGKLAYKDKNNRWVDYHLTTTPTDTAKNIYNEGESPISPASDDPYAPTHYGYYNAIQTELKYKSSIFKDDADVVISLNGSQFSMIPSDTYKYEFRKKEMAYIDVSTTDIYHDSAGTYDAILTNISTVRGVFGPQVEVYVNGNSYQMNVTDYFQKGGQKHPNWCLLPKSSIEFNNLLSDLAADDYQLNFYSGVDMTEWKSLSYDTEFLKLDITPVDTDGLVCLIPKNDSEFSTIVSALGAAGNKIIYVSGVIVDNLPTANVQTKKVDGLTPSLSFRINDKNNDASKLGVREFEVEYHASGEKFNDNDDVKKDYTSEEYGDVTVCYEGYELGNGYFEIIKVEEGDEKLPIPTTHEKGIVPYGTKQVSDLCSKGFLFNIAFTEDGEEVTSAQAELLTEALKAVSELNKDHNTYTFELNPVWLENHEEDYYPGRKVTFHLIGGYSLSSRILSVTTKLDYDFCKTITVGNEVSKGIYSQLRSELEGKVATTISGSIGGNGNSVYGDYISKAYDDETEYLVTFLAGLVADRFIRNSNYKASTVVGDNINGGKGFAIEQKNGLWRLEIDNILARRLVRAREAYLNTLSVSESAEIGSGVIEEGGRILPSLKVNGHSEFTHDLYSSDFISAFIGGQGWSIQRKERTNVGGVTETYYELEIDNITVRNLLRVYEFVVSQLRGENDNYMFAAFLKVHHYDPDFVNPNTHIQEPAVWLQTEQGKFYNPFRKDDCIVVQQYCGENDAASGGDGYITKHYELVITDAGMGGETDVDENGDRIDWVTFKNFQTDMEGGSPLGLIKKDDTFVRQDNLSDPERKGVIQIMTVGPNTPYMDVDYGLVTDPNNALKSRIGKLEGLVTPHFGKLEGFGAYINNLYSVGRMLNHQTGERYVSDFVVTNENFKSVYNESTYDTSGNFLYNGEFQFGIDKWSYDSIYGNKNPQANEDTPVGDKDGSIYINGELLASQKTSKIEESTCDGVRVIRLNGHAIRQSWTDMVDDNGTHEELKYPDAQMPTEEDYQKELPQYYQDPNDITKKKINPSTGKEYTDSEINTAIAAAKVANKAKYDRATETEEIPDTLYLAVRMKPVTQGNLKVSIVNENGVSREILYEYQVPQNIDYKNFTTNDTPNNPWVWDITKNGYIKVEYTGECLLRFVTIQNNPIDDLSVTFQTLFSQNARRILLEARRTDSDRTMMSGMTIQYNAIVGRVTTNEEADKTYIYDLLGITINNDGTYTFPEGWEPDPSGNYDFSSWRIQTSGRIEDIVSKWDDEGHLIGYSTTTQTAEMISTEVVRVDKKIIDVSDLGKWEQGSFTSIGGKKYDDEGVKIASSNYIRYADIIPVTKDTTFTLNEGYKLKYIFFNGDKVIPSSGQTGGEKVPVNNKLSLDIPDGIYYVAIAICKNPASAITKSEVAKTGISVIDGKMASTSYVVQTAESITQTVTNNKEAADAAFDNINNTVIPGLVDDIGAVDTKANASATWITNNKDRISLISAQFDSEGNLTNTSGLVTGNGSFATLFTKGVQDAELVTEAQMGVAIEDFVDADGVNQLISVATINADKISFNASDIVWSMGKQWTVLNKNNQAILYLDASGNLSIGGQLTATQTNLNITNANIGSLMVFDNASQLKWKSNATTGSKVLTMLTLDGNNQFVVGEGLTSAQTSGDYARSNDSNYRLYLRGTKIIFQTGYGNSGSATDYGEKATLTSDGVLEISAIKIGDTYIGHDSSNEALKVYKISNGSEVAGNLYTKGWLSAYGVGSTSGGGGVELNPVLAHINTHYNGTTFSPEDNTVLIYYNGSWKSQALSGYVKTSGTQTISGIKTFSTNVYVGGSPATGVSAKLYVNGATYLNGNTTSNGNLTLSSGNNLNANGRVGIGAAANSSYQLYVNGNSLMKGRIYFYVSSSATINIESYTNPGGNYLNVNATGICVNGSTISSDMRKKNVVSSIDDLKVEDIASAPVFNFTWKDESNGKGTHVGTSAQYWQSVLPNAVLDMGELGLTLDYNAVSTTSAVITARKVVEQEKEIQALKDEVAELKELVKQLMAKG